MPQKLSERKREKLIQQKLQRKSESLAYSGNKYKKDKLTPAWMETEIAIYQTYVITDRTLVDKTVASAIAKLIGMMQSGALPPLPDEVHYRVG